MKTFVACSAIVLALATVASAATAPRVTFVLGSKARANARGGIRKTHALRLDAVPSAFRDLADGTHIISVVSGGREVACGAIPPHR